jgi:putative FmdB family regulatory protein
MPTYEYECLSCRHQFEQYQRITDKPLTRCPKCGKRVRRRIGTGAGILFKGSGFYATDYRSESYKKASREDKAAPSTPAAKKEPAAPAKKES